ncbi:MAG: histidinol dehydrogenase, partial [Dehalococcoidia bacterium]|nr:histidinol dehydrogenase [Dehalococcoidia bacterium]
MRIIRGTEAARKFVSKRLSAEYYDNPSEQVVKGVIDQVRDRGDAALLEYSRKFNGVDLERFEVSESEIEEACAGAAPELVSALELAAERICSFQIISKGNGVQSFRDGGLGQIVRTLKRVGIYVPGGTASYPSTMLMTAIPA